MFVRSANYLTELLGDFVGFPRLVVIAGHPGSGKISLASTICLYALEKNEKCLYISFQEDRDRLYSQLEDIGINFRKYDEKGFLKFVKFPLSISEQVVQQFVDDISRLVLDFNPRVVVVDSATPLLEVVKENTKIRSYLQNFFWELQKIINGVVVLVVEMLLGHEYAGLGGIEFVADAVLILKHRIHRGLIERVMEIRKIRGGELTVAEIPFSIRSGMGIVFYPPIVLSEIRSVKKRTIIHGKEFKLYEMETPSLIVYIEYPPELTLSIPLIYVVLNHVLSNGKVLIIDYRCSEEQLRDYIKDTLKLYGADDKVIDYVLSNVVIRSINPTAYSTPEGIAEELSIIEEVKPDVVVFHDIAVFASLFAKELENFVSQLYNELLYLTQRGIDVTRLGGRVNPQFSSVNKMLANHAVDIMCADSLCSKYIVNIAARGRRYTLEWEEFEDHIKKIIGYIKQKLG
ncbi:MAG: AAA family ATPase [Desulfurococcaceae archaeon]|nr:AAA family ATPase [Desulfurococcaceae archaeon]